MRAITMRVLLAVGIAVGAAAPSWAGPFTGPTSPYYLDNFSNQTIYVVQGTTVINQFPWAYNAFCPVISNCEGVLAVTGSYVSTDWFGNTFLGLSTVASGQYTLSGTPTGTQWNGTPPPAGETENEFLDGTTDGTHNYTVEYEGTTGNALGPLTENIIQTDLNWQNPVDLFSVQSAPSAFAEWAGIAYDPVNNSLWISGFTANAISDYSLTGALLSSFAPEPPGSSALASALGFDPADDTLWFSSDGTNVLYQYDTSGNLLQFGGPVGLISALYDSGDFSIAAASTPTGVAEPGSLRLFIAAFAGLLLMRRPQRNSRSRFDRGAAQTSC